MKRLQTMSMAAVMMLAVCMNADAQNPKKVDNFGIFNHLSVGVSLGLDGIGIDVASCATDYVQVRAGASFFPRISYNQMFSPNMVPGYSGVANSLANIPASLIPAGSTPFVTPGDIEIQAKLGFNTAKILVDVYPFPKKTSFHLTAGLYMGSSDIVTLRNVDPTAFNGYIYPYLGPAPLNGPGYSYDPSKADEIMYGIRLGNYRLKPNKEGFLEAGLNVNAVRPYLGFGFGRAVPKKRIGFMFEAGVQIWGSPRLYFDGGDGRHYITSEDFTDNGSNDGGLISTLNDLRVYPMMTFRLTGRIF